MGGESTYLSGCVVIIRQGIQFHEQLVHTLLDLFVLLQLLLLSLNLLLLLLEVFLDGEEEKVGRLMACTVTTSYERLEAIGG